MRTPSSSLTPMAGKYILDLPEPFITRMATGLFLLDRDFALQRWSPNWVGLIARYIAFPADRVVPGVGLFELLPATEAALRPLLELAAAGETVDRKTVRLEFEGVETYWDLGFMQMEAEGGTNIAGMMTDVTTRTLAYQALEREAQARIRELSSVLKISSNLVSLDPQPLLELILDQLKAVVDYSGATVATLREGVFSVISFRGPFPANELLGWQPPFQGLMEQLGTGHRNANQTDAIIIPDIRGDTPMARAFREAAGERFETAFSEVRSWMGVPMRVKDQVTGLMGLQHSRPDWFSPKEADLASAFAGYAAVALENDRLYQQAHQGAILKERNLLAQELHDNIAQALAYINLKVSTSQSLLANGQLKEAEAYLREIKQIVGDTYTDVREEIFNLRSKEVVDLGFLDMLRKYIEKYKAHYDLDVELVMEIDETLLNFPTDVGHQTIRIIQEALINVRKHAGVDKAVLRFRQEGSEVQIRVEDSGQGFDLAQIDRTGLSGFGLQIMMERAESAGGHLELDSSPGGGVRVIIRMPIMSGK